MPDGISSVQRGANRWGDPNGNSRHEEKARDERVAHESRNPPSDMVGPEGLEPSTRGL